MRGRSSAVVANILGAHANTLHRGDLRSLRVLAELRGAGAAAWLVRKHRAQLRARGVVDFRIPEHDITPPWFRVAFECLRQSPKWSVTRFCERGCRVYRVVWNHWRGAARPELAS